MYGEKLSHWCPQLLLLKKFDYNNRRFYSIKELSSYLTTSVTRLAWHTLDPLNIYLTWWHFSSYFEILLNCISSALAVSRYIKVIILIITILRLSSWQTIWKPSSLQTKISINNLLETKLIRIFQRPECFTDNEQFLKTVSCFIVWVRKMYC